MLQSVEVSPCCFAFGSEAYTYPKEENVEEEEEGVGAVGVGAVGVGEEEEPRSLYRGR